jgi:two-component system sensor kinase FixL
MMKIEEELNGRRYFSIKFPIIQGKRTLLAGYTIDVTEQKLAEQTLQQWNQTLERRIAERTADLNQSEARFRQLAEATFEGIAITENGKLLDGNPQFAELHGYELAEMLGRPVTDFITAEFHVQVLEHIQGGSFTPYEFVGLRKDGSTFPAEAHGTMRSWQGRSIRVTALRDLSSVKKVEASLLAQQAELEQAQRLAMLSEVSSGIIHQIGQPLSAMGANLMVVLSRLRACRKKNCDTLEIIQDVESDVARMRKSVTHLRELAHPERSNRVPMDFNALLAGVLRLLRQEIESQQFRVVCEAGKDLQQVLADEVQLGQVILNLVRNAFDACANRPPEQRTLVITTREIAGQGVEMAVRDTGPGITAEAMPHLFTPFFSTKPDGLGIGLRLSRTIVEIHGGRIEGRNNSDGIGATFRVILPFHSPPS